MIPRGSLLNGFTVALGGLIGWLAGQRLDPAVQTAALSGLGLVTIGIGIRMFLKSQNVLVVAAAIAIGGMVGAAMGLQARLEGFAGWIQHQMGAAGESQFVTVLVGSFVLYCVGPMTLLGCVEERLSGKIDLLAVKSTLDGVAAIFFAVKSPTAILVTAVFVMLFQSALTLAAKPLSPLARDEGLMGELTGSGGAMLLGTGLGLLQIKDVSVANYLPALVLAPLFVAASRWVIQKRAQPGN